AQICERHRRCHRKKDNRRPALLLGRRPRESWGVEKHNLKNPLTGDGRASSSDGSAGEIRADKDSKGDKGEHDAGRNGGLEQREREGAGGPSRRRSWLEAIDCVSFFHLLPRLFLSSRTFSTACGMPRTNPAVCSYLNTSPPDQTC